MSIPLKANLNNQLHLILGRKDALPPDKSISWTISTITFFEFYVKIVQIKLQMFAWDSITSLSKKNPV